MPRRLFALSLFLVASLATSPAGAEPDFTEGLWSVTSEIKMEGLPFAMPPFTYTQCITKQDMVPQQQKEDQECTRVSQKVEGNSVKWVTTCTDKQGTSVESTGSATYAGTSFTATVRNVITDPGKTTSTMTMTLKGKRTGACPAK